MNKEKQIKFAKLVNPECDFIENDSSVGDDQTSHITSHPTLSSVHRQLQAADEYRKRRSIIRIVFYALILVTFILVFAISIIILLALLITNIPFNIPSHWWEDPSSNATTTPMYPTIYTTPIPIFFKFSVNIPMCVVSIVVLTIIFAFLYYSIRFRKYKRFHPATHDFFDWVCAGFSWDGEIDIDLVDTQDNVLLVPMEGKMM